MNSIHPTAMIASDVTLGDHVQIGEEVIIDHGAIIRDHVQIGAGSYIGCQCILGEYLYDYYLTGENKPHPLVIGQKALIRSGTIIYGDVLIGSHLQTGHRATIREKSVIGHHVRLGTMADIQGRCEIGDYVSIHSGVFVAPNSVIHSYAWLFPHVVLTNDPTPPSESEAGITIGRYASIAARALILPGVMVGEDALVGAGAVVTKDVPSGKVVVGAPAKIKCDVQSVLNRETGLSAYPWRYHFDRGMPWEGIGYDIWEESCGDMGQKQET